jgi:nucleoside-diphosphate-sugar epimerase
MKCLVTGAGGFIGGHLVNRLLADGHSVRGVDKKPLTAWWQLNPHAENWRLNLSYPDNCHVACRGMDWVFNLAADMGGIGHIERNHCDCAMNVLISAHMLQAAHGERAQRFFYSSSACIYAADKQDSPDVLPLKESDAFPAMPEIGYGEEKLFSERLAQYWREDHGLETRIARFHNSYGPFTSWNDGREKAPAAFCRKVAMAKLTGDHTIDVWGDGTRTRSCMWIGDNGGGIIKIMESDIREPINLGSSEGVTVNRLIDIVEDIAGIQCRRVYDMDQPQGVHGRNSDNTMILDLLGWQPTTPLRTGLSQLYPWVEEQVRKSLAGT